MKKVICSVFLAACAHSSPMTQKSSRPCLTTLPTSTRMKILSDPEKVPYLDAEGNPHTAMRVAVDVDSASAFFNYIETLEGIAKKALGCVVR